MMPSAAPASERRSGARQRVWWLTLAGAIIGVSCGDGDIRAKSANSDALPPVADDSCARFGFHFTEGGCPDAECAEPLCSCPAPIRCISGMDDRCMTGVDCATACAFDATTLFVCSVSIEPCQADDECAAGRCVTEAGAANGECESGERGARCRDDQDCKIGNCVAGTDGNRACSPGEESDLCNRDRDCQSAQCVVEGDALTGECE
jgi:hypothetical protein